MFKVAPVRVRGLKLLKPLPTSTCFFSRMASGVWIETYSRLLIRATSLVAPRAGAWIETGKNAVVSR